MMRALWSAASGMTAQELNVDTIANNLANVNTIGFKKQRVEFQDLMYETLRSPGAAAAEGVEIPTGIQVGLGSRTAATRKLFAQGTFQETGNPLDLVIEGSGFFQVLMPNGSVAYTRAGAFKIDSEGNVVNADGFPLEPPLVIPTDTTSIAVGSDGTVSATTAGSTEPQTIGQIELARFANPAGLQNLGHSLLRATAASGEPTTGAPGIDGLGGISQGMLEMSNVKVVEEMVNMITAQRAYEANSQAIRIADQMLEIANNTRR
ncbi:MAG: flagellar basal-body rod protein FlgG [Armatimonadota bacterium]|nr:flagellar basal-body rod protein FlgG [Armatimonadota bacterium]